MSKSIQGPFALPCPTCSFFQDFPNDEDDIHNYNRASPLRSAKPLIGKILALAICPVRRSNLEAGRETYGCSSAEAHFCSHQYHGFKGSAKQSATILVAASGNMPRKIFRKYIAERCRLLGYQGGSPRRKHSSHKGRAIGSSIYMLSCQRQHQ